MGRAIFVGKLPEAKCPFKQKSESFAAFPNKMMGI
jgi:hypothetical protein